MKNVEKIIYQNGIKKKLREHIFCDVYFDKTQQFCIDDFSKSYNRGLCWLWWYTKILGLQQKQSSVVKNSKNKRGFYGGWFFDVEKLVDDWDGKRNLSDQESREIARFAILNRYFSFVGQEMELEERFLSGSVANRFWGKISCIRIIDNPKRNEILKESLEAVKNKGLTKEYSIGSLFTVDQIRQLLSTDRFIKNKRLIILESSNSDKCSAILKNDYCYFYFNADDKECNSEFKISSIEEIVDLVCSTHSCCSGIMGRDNDLIKFGKYFPLEIKIFSFGKGISKYPNHNNILDVINPTINIKEHSSLITATRAGSLETVRYFLKKGANPNIEDKNNNTPLMLAAFEGYIDIVKLFIAAGADINIQCDSGYTALMYASCGDSEETISVLLSSPKMDVNLQGEDGEAALMLAVKSFYHNEAIVKNLLFDKRINVDIKNNEGITALDLAIFTDIKQLFYDCAA